MLWRCKSCKTANPAPARRCTVCRRMREGGEEEFQVPSIRAPMRTDPKIMAEREETARRSHDALVQLRERLVAAADRLKDAPAESIPPKGAVRVVVPKGAVGWVTVAAVVLGLAFALAVVKSLL